MSEYEIVVPLDGSRLAEHPLVYLKALKNLGDVSVELLSVVDISEHYPGMDEIETRERATNLLATYQREVADDIREHAGIEVARKIVTGVPAYCLANEVLQEKPDLLVLATHGRSGVARWRFGSVADKLIRGAECNTLVIGPKASEHETWVDVEIEPPFKTILVPLDGSKLAEQAVAVARQYAATFGSTLHFVSVARLVTAAAGFGMEGYYAPVMIEETVSGLQEYLKETAKDAGPSQVKTEVLTGDAALVLDDYCRLNGIDLIVMTSHGRGGLVRTALGSVTDRMLSTAVAPVLIVRPIEDDSPNGER